MKAGDLSTSPARDVVLLSASTNDLGDVRCLRATADCTVDIVTANNNVRSGFPLFKGDNPIAVRQVTAITGAGVSVWAIY